MRSGSTSNRELRAIARGEMLGRYGRVILAMIIASGIPTIISYIFSLVNPIGTDATLAQYIVDIIVTVIITMIGKTLEAGLFKIHLAIARNKEYQVKDIFSVFREKPDRFLLAAFFIYLLTVLPLAPGVVVFRKYGDAIKSGNDEAHMLMCTALFLVGMIIAIFFSLRYSFVFFILADNEDTGAIEAMRSSASYMKNRYFKKLGMELSFIGYWALSIISIGIGYLWVGTYMNHSLTHFYLDAIE